MAKTQSVAKLSIAAQSFADTACVVITDAADVAGTTSAVLCAEIIALQDNSQDFVADVGALFGTGTGKATIKGAMHVRLGDYASSGSGRNLLSRCRAICEALTGEHAELVRAALERGALDPAYKARNGAPEPKLGSKGPKGKGKNDAGTPKEPNPLQARITRAEFIAREIALDGGKGLMLDFAAALRTRAQTIRATEVDAVAEKLAA